MSRQTMSVALPASMRETIAGLSVDKATAEALDQVEVDPGIGPPGLGTLLGAPGLRDFRVWKFPLLRCDFELGVHLDAVRLLGERQDIAAILGDAFASN